MRVLSDVDRRYWSSGRQDDHRKMSDKRLVAAIDRTLGIALESQESEDGLLEAMENCSLLISEHWGLLDYQEQYDEAQDLRRALPQDLQLEPRLLAVRDVPFSIEWLILLLQLLLESQDYPLEQDIHRMRRAIRQYLGELSEEEEREAEAFRVWLIEGTGEL